MSIMREAERIWALLILLVLSVALALAYMSAMSSAVKLAWLGKIFAAISCGIINFVCDEH